MLTLYRTIEATPNRSAYCLLVPAASTQVRGADDGGWSSGAGAWGTKDAPLECEAPRTPLQLFFGAANTSIFPHIETDIFAHPRFENASSAVSALGVAPLVLAELLGASTLIDVCHSTCGTAQAAAQAAQGQSTSGRALPSPTCLTSDVVAALTLPQQLSLLQALEGYLKTMPPGMLGAGGSSGASDGGGGLGSAFESAGSCDAYAMLAAYGQSDAARVLRLHYQLTMLTLNEWSRPLPPPNVSLVPHDPDAVAILVGHLLTFPSLARFAALYALAR